MNQATNNRAGNNPKSGMSLVEVMVATVLLIMGLSTFLTAFSSIQRVSITANNRMVAMHKAREIMESVMSEKYTSNALNIGTHSVDNGTYRVSLASGFITTKDIAVTVQWINPVGNSTHNLILYGSMAKCIH